MGNYELFYPGEIDRLRKTVARLEKEVSDLRAHRDPPPYLVIDNGRVIPLLPDEVDYIVHWLATGSKKGKTNG